MDLENQAAESGLDSGNAGGEVRNEAPRDAGMSLRDSMAKAASTIRDRGSDNGSANPASDEGNTAFEKSDTLARSLTAEPGSQEEVAPSILEAPKHWPQKRRDAFGRFVSEKPDLAKEWLDHTKELEGEFTRKSQEHADHRKFADSVRELFTPEHRSIMQQNGVNETSAIKWLMDVDAYARRDPGGYAKWFMQQAGLTPQQLFPELGQGAAPQAQTEQEWVDPELVKTREELGTVKSQLQQFQSWIQQQEQTRHQSEQARKAAEQQASLNIIQQFADAKDDAGNLLHPHFEELVDEIGFQLSRPEFKSQPASVEKVKAAYERALWSHDQTRQSMLEQQRSTEAAEFAKRQAAEKARAAQTLKPKINSAAGASAAPAQDLKSLIRDAAGRARG